MRFRGGIRPDHYNREAIERIPLHGVAYIPIVDGISLNTEPGCTFAVVVDQGALSTNHPVTRCCI